MRAKTPAAQGIQKGLVCSPAKGVAIFNTWPGFQKRAGYVPEEFSLSGGNQEFSPDSGRGRFSHNGHKACSPPGISHCNWNRELHDERKQTRRNRNRASPLRHRTRLQESDVSCNPNVSPLSRPRTRLVKSNLVGNPTDPGAAPASPKLEEWAWTGAAELRTFQRAW